MARFTIPEAQAENPQPQGKGGNFPPGTWRGQVEAVRVQTICRGDNDGKQDFLLQDSSGFNADQAEIASIQLGGATAALEGQEDPGARKVFDEKIYLSLDGVSWDDPGLNGDTNWRLISTRKRLTNLALALGVVDREGDQVGPVDDFDSLFRETVAEGTGFFGQPVIFEVYHRTFARKADPKGQPSGLEVVVAKYEQAI